MQTQEQTTQVPSQSNRLSPLSPPHTSAKAIPPISNRSSDTPNIPLTTHNIRRCKLIHRIQNFFITTSQGFTRRARHRAYSRSHHLICSTRGWRYD
eukprot:UN16188